MEVPVLILAAALLSPATEADEIFLKSGGQISGRVVSRTADKVEIDIGAGRISVPPSSVVRIEEGKSPLQDYEERARQAEADAASASTDGLPLWYGWGAGPVYWPTGPIVSQPIRNPPSTRPARVPR